MAASTFRHVHGEHPTRHVIPYSLTRPLLESDGALQQAGTVTYLSHPLHAQ